MFKKYDNSRIIQAEHFVAKTKIQVPDFFKTTWNENWTHKHNPKIFSTLYIWNHLTRVDSLEIGKSHSAIVYQRPGYLEIVICFIISSNWIRIYASVLLFFKYSKKRNFWNPVGICVNANRENEFCYIEVMICWKYFNSNPSINLLLALNFN